MKNEKGKFIVFEGIDGSGKSTQTKLLAGALKGLGFKVAKMDFPQYGKKSAGLVEEYLTGKYGSAKEVGPKRASIFYACDRYDASFKLKKLLSEGTILISDRYVASSIGHQGGKIKDRKKRSEFFRWLYNLEYNFFGIPVPDITFILKTSPESAYELSGKITDRLKKKKKQLYLGNRKRDLHERDIQHLRDALGSYLQVAEEFPEEYKVIECIQDGKLLSPKIIHQKILAEAKKIL
jgi:dTMP kinase